MADPPIPGDRPDDPFGGLPLFGDLARALAGQGPLNWDAARQFAQLGATSGRVEHNVDPLLRSSYTELARIAGMHVLDVTGADISLPDPELLTPGQCRVVRRVLEGAGIPVLLLSARRASTLARRPMTSSALSTA